ncbi:wolframin-like [Ciona intestinalis]
MLKLSKNVKDVSNITEEECEMIDRRFMEGHVPRVRQCDEESDSESEEEEEEDHVKDFPEDSKLSVYDRVSKVQHEITCKVKVMVKTFASKYARSFLKRLIPVQQLSTLASFVLFSYIMNATFLMNFIPVVIFYLSFSALVLATVHLFKGDKRFREFTAWSAMLVDIKSPEERDNAENNYIQNHLSPLTSLLPAVALIVMSHAVTPQAFIVYPELALISLCCLAACCRSFGNTVISTTFILQLCASAFELLLPLKLVTFPVMFFQTSAMVSVSISSILRLAAFCVLLSVPFQKKYRNLLCGCFLGFVPQLFVMIWWELLLFFLKESSTQGLFRALLEAFAISFSIHALIIVLILFFLSSLATLHFVQILITLLLLLVPLLYVKLSQKWKDLYVKIPFSRITPSQKILASVLSSIVIILVLLLYQPSGLSVTNSNLKFEDYRRVCIDQQLANQAFVQRACHHLDGHYINWKGNVTNIRIRSIDNKFEGALSVFPGSIASWLSCVYGDYYTTHDQCSNKSCDLESLSQHHCHLERYNSYTFDLTVAINDTDIKLTAGNTMKNFMFSLQPSVEINFKGLLDSDHNQVTLTFVKVEGDKDVKSQVAVVSRHQVAELLMHAFYSLFQFAFGPTVEILDATL